MHPAAPADGIAQVSRVRMSAIRRADAGMYSLVALAALSGAWIREGQRANGQEVELSPEALGKLGGELYYDPVLMLRVHQRLSLLDPEGREAALRRLSGPSSSSTLIRNVVSAAFEPRSALLPLFFEEYLEEQAELRAAMPAFPVVFIEGLPFQVEELLVLSMAGKTGGGSIAITGDEEFIRWSMASANPRPMPKDMPDSPLDAVDRFLSGDSPAVQLLSKHGKEWVAGSLRQQAYRCVCHLAHTEVTEALGFDPLDHLEITEKSWQVVKEILHRSRPRWNPETLSYEAGS